MKRSINLAFGISILLTALFPLTAQSLQSKTVSFRLSKLVIDNTQSPINIKSETVCENFELAMPKTQEHGQLSLIGECATALKGKAESASIWVGEASGPTQTIRGGKGLGKTISVAFKVGELFVQSYLIQKNPAPASSQIILDSGKAQTVVNGRSIFESFRVDVEFEQ